VDKLSVIRLTFEDYWRREKLTRNYFCSLPSMKIVPKFSSAFSTASSLPRMTPGPYSPGCLSHSVSLVGRLHPFFLQKEMLLGFY
jgi:hypothetical protein